MRSVPLADLAGILDRVAAEATVLPQAAAEVAAPVLAEAIRNTMGHDPPLQTLAASTQDERVRLGYTPNDPLVRTGSLAASVESAAVNGVAMAGSADPRSAWHEIGTRTIPSRPAFRDGLAQATPGAAVILSDLGREMMKE